MMKMQFLIRILLASLCVSLLLILEGCGGRGGDEAASLNRDSFNNAPSPPKLEPPLFATVEEADSKINYLQKHIKDLKDFEKQEMKNGAINDINDTLTNHAVKLDGQPTYEDLRNQHYEQVAGTQKEIVQLEKQLATAQKEKDKLTSQSKGCFLPDALVQMENGTFKPLVEIVPGDMVMTYDIGLDKQVSRPVVELYSVQSNHLYTINGEFETTGGERLLSQDGWKEVSNLRQGDVVHVNGNMLEIRSIEYQNVEHRLHNMQVSDTHNFYVSTLNGTKYLVHNSGGGGGGK